MPEVESASQRVNRFQERVGYNPVWELAASRDGETVHAIRSTAPTVATAGGPPAIGKPGAVLIPR
jgi:hypothetical protein